MEPGQVVGANIFAIRCKRIYAFNNNLDVKAGT